MQVKRGIWFVSFVSMWLSGCGGNKPTTPAAAPGLVTRGHFHRLKQFMPLAEVQTVLGPGEEQGADFNHKSVIGLEFVDLANPPGGKPGDKIRWYRWGDKDRYIMAGFIKDELVFSVYNGP